MGRSLNNPSATHTSLIDSRRHDRSHRSRRSYGFANTNRLVFADLFVSRACLAPSIADCCFARIVSVWNVAGGRDLRVPSSNERPSAPPRGRASDRSALAQRSRGGCLPFTSPPWAAGRTAPPRAPGTASPVASAISSAKALGRGRRRPRERRRVVRTDQAWLSEPLERSIEPFTPIPGPGVC
jgi:hypothetical protein